MYSRRHKDSRPPPPYTTTPTIHHASRRPGEAPAPAQRKMLASVGLDKQPLLQDAFVKLMEGLDQTLEPLNRDKFT